MNGLWTHMVLLSLDGRRQYQSAYFVLAHMCGVTVAATYDDLEVVSSVHLSTYLLCSREHMIR